MLPKGLHTAITLLHLIGKLLLMFYPLEY